MTVEEAFTPSKVRIFAGKVAEPGTPENILTRETVTKANTITNVQSTS